MKSRLDIVPLPYHADPLERFARLRHRHGAVLLDSGRPEAPGGRYDIMSCEPRATFEVTAEGQVRSEMKATLPDDPFAAQQALLDTLDTDLPDSDLPFLGGLIGYWSYDLGRILEPLPSRARAVTSLPWCRLGLYDWALIHDHVRQEAWLVATPERRRQVETWLCETVTPALPFAITAPFQAEMDRLGYGERFRTVQRYIRAGDCYQINLAQRFSTSYRGDLWQAYQALRRATPTPFAGYMAWADKAVLSVSPERFIRIDRGQVETRPIKGTRPRGTTAEQDARLAAALVDSDKDKAENVMIVDLLRNDLGRVCRPGSVRVPQLCGLESYANVHHLVSVVTGELDGDHTPLDLLAAAFPGGSITGAPKVRAMQIIDELEPSRRSAYCGSLGYVDRRGSMDTSIAIRSVVADAGRLHVWGGGGLVADSDESEEYQETLAKISRLMDALAEAGPRDGSRPNHLSLQDLS
ncbi:MAG: aminodeoxychorismate synthase component I [Halomonas sp.]|nr:aminodeoxychorismate synthase component I [Halomonas sp.]